MAGRDRIWGGREGALLMRAACRLQDRAVVARAAVTTWLSGPELDAHRLVARLQVFVLVVAAFPVWLVWRGQADRLPGAWSLAVLAGLLVALAAALRSRDRWCAWALWLTSVGGALTLPHVVLAPLQETVWLGQLSPVTIGCTVLMFRRTWMCGVAAALLLVAGGLSRSSVVESPGMGVVATLVGFVGVWWCTLVVVRTLEFGQQRLERLRSEAVADYVTARAEEATVRAEQAWDAYLHDEVVATMATVSSGDADDARREATRLLGTVRAAAGAEVPAPWVGVGALDSVMRVRPDAETSIDIDPDCQVLPERVRHAVLEAFNEALRNVGRHAYGSSGEGPCRVEVVLDDREVRVAVTDWGRGFDPRAVPESRLGLAVSVQGRMDAIGGWVQVETGIGRGTRVEVGWDRSVGETW